jgi:hypothetical protein
LQSYRNKSIYKQKKQYIYNLQSERVNTLEDQTKDKEKEEYSILLKQLVVQISEDKKGSFWKW